jgi:hypothetical protein
MTNEEKFEKFEEIINEQDRTSKDLQLKAKKCLEGAKSVKKAE